MINKYKCFQYGFTFGVTNLAGFIASPICAKYSDYFGVTRLYALGSFVLSICTMCYGLLVYLEDKLLFLGVSYLVR